ncbi:hypothetical protein PACTADRAFT_61531 [Pachysolen tannophilus NRRL Y-2460]|uniref:Alpha-MPP n=1 Tax=Pachysolen tannophilus NRRL Y-2460 TaxID=669874 RepID=A0A1E4TQB7_PACTA|nr:hypothetical protein PACTADRAFT_61531 [Pachysolen tannophilus NRRL Y-2460]
MFCRSISSKGFVRCLRNYSTIVESPTQLSTLSNGIRVVTDSLPGHFSAVGIYVDAGSRYESVENGLQGCSHIIDRLAFKSTENYTGKKMLENLNHLGGNFMCASSRESMIYQASVFNPEIEKMFSLLSETVSKPLLTESEVEEQKLTAQYELDEIWMQSDLILPELLQQRAYNFENLGSPLLCPIEKLQDINRDKILKYREFLYRPDNLVVALLGVPHEEAVRLTEKYLGHLKQPSQPKLKASKAKYTGGVLSLPPQPPIGNLPEFHHIHVGFEGLPIEHEDIYALATLQMLLGGGGSFSAGGPGKGMYSRAYTRILNQYGFIESCKSFIHNFTDSGLFGISISCIPQASKIIPELIGNELSLLFSHKTGRGALTTAEIDRAKNQLRSSLLMNLESKMVQLEDLGRQIQVYGRKISINEMCDKINALTQDNLVRVAEKVLTGSRPTVIIQGNEEEFGDVEHTLKKFGLGPNSNDYVQPTKTDKKKGIWF